MERGINNNLESSYVGKDYIGHDNINIYGDILLYQDTEREFVVTHNAAIKCVSYFTGRETELDELRKRVEEGRKSVLVSGMGGIGKTSICRKLFEEYTNKNGKGETISFKHIGYIEYEGSMDSSLMNCLKYKQQANPEKNCEAAWKELEYLASSGKFLLFIDNVNVFVSEDPNLQRLKSLPGAVILTSRQTLFSKEFELLKIGFLCTEQCREIYEKIRFKNTGKKINKEEVSDLNYIIEVLAAKHTITVEFLAHLAQTKHWTVKRLRQELEQNGFQLEYRDEENKLVNIQNAYETLYNLSKLTKAEQNILEAFSIFPYLSLSVNICNKWLLSDAGVGEEADILEGLYRKGWLQFNIEQESYSLHPVFAKFIHEKCKPTMKKHSGLIKMCQENLIIPENGSALECQKYIPFAESIIENIDMGQGLEKADFIFNLAYLLCYIADYKKAENLYEKSFEIYKKQWGENHPDIARNYNNLAGVYDRQGKYEKAEKLYKKGLEIYKRLLGENQLETAISYNNLAGVYNRQGKYEEVEELYKKGLEIRERLLGKNHPETATSYNNLAGVYSNQGKYKEAEKLYKKGLEIYERLLGENHKDTAISYNDLAIVYNKQGKYKEVEKLYKKVLEIQKKLLGENHPDTASSYSNLAMVYNEQGKYKEAEKLCKKALEIHEKLLGENHPDTATSYNNLAGVYDKQGKYEEAEKLCKKALEIQKRLLGENHPNTASSYNNLAGVYNNQEKYEEAEKLYKKGLEIYERLLGENHPDTAVSYGNLAYVYYRQGKYRKVEKLYKKALEIQKRLLGENHPNTATSYNNLAGVYDKQGKYEEAKKLYKKGLEIREKLLGENHLDTASSYNNLARVYNTQGKYKEAEKLYKKGLQICEKLLGENHKDIASRYNELGYLYLKQGKYKITLSYSLKAYQILVFKLGLQHPDTQIVYKNMKIAYSKYNTNGNFTQWLEENMNQSKQHEFLNNKP